MSQSLRDIAKQLRASDKTVQLIYAFNGSGKTRLSREFKNLIALENVDEDAEDSSSRSNILYYNAFTEDLFYWNNDLEYDLAPKLLIQPNSFTDWALKDQGLDQRVIETFQRYTNDKLTPEFNAEFSEVTFSFQSGDDAPDPDIKISKGEESNFIWSLFQAIFDQVIQTLNVAEEAERDTDQFNELQYIFIDDPVSSLDENHLIQLAVSLASTVRQSTSSLKFIISTHNPLFYNVLYNEVGAKNGFILSRTVDGSFALEEKKGDSNKTFSYHLHIKNIIEQATANATVQKYHFALLRNLYEKTANFLGYPRWSDLLPDDQKTYAKRVMNFYPHNTLSNEEISEPTAPEREMVKFLLDHLVNNYSYWKEVNTGA
jgi:hypothetical protein